MKRLLILAAAIFATACADTFTGTTTPPTSGSVVCAVDTIPSVPTRVCNP